MHALFFDHGIRYLNDFPVPQPNKNEALIKVICTGICNTDLEIIKGYMGFTGIPGHEFVGIVEASENDHLKGKRVVGDINISCGECLYCKQGLRNHCPERSVLGILNKNGAFAEYLTLPVNNLHQVPDTVSDGEAVFVEPLAAAFEVLKQVNITESDKVCVLGDGKLGLLVAQVLSTTGANLITVGKHPDKLSILSRMGIETHVLSSFDENEFDIVVDCTGSRSGIEKALKIVKPGGKVVLKTTVAEKGAVDLNHIVINEISLIGSRCGPFPDAIDAIVSKKVDLLPLISAEYNLEEGLKALEHASRKGILKIILKVV